MLSLTLEQVREYEKEYSAVPVYAEVFADMTTPIAFLSKVRACSNNYFLLESVEGGEKWGRYSFIGFDPCLRIMARNNRMEVKSTAEVGFACDEPLNCLREVLAEYRVPRLPGLPPFTGGFVGYFAYEFFKYCERGFRFSEDKNSEFPDFDLMLFDKVIAFDHLKQKILIIANVKTDSVAVNYCKAAREIGHVRQLLQNTAVSADPAPARLGSLIPNMSKQEYIACVQKGKAHIREGDVFQVVLSQQFTADYDSDLFNAYRVLRTTNPSQYMVLLKNEEIEIAGSSPETLVKVNGREITTMPIAGTRRRGATETEDLLLEEELLADEKETAEHNMLVDLARNDVGRVSSFGSVEVLDYKKISRFSHVMHITTRVTGERRQELDNLDVLCSIFPAGTLSGAPKIRACEIIDELEPSARGLYGGGMGYIDFSGNLDVCITIRTIVKRAGKVYVQAGAGIVADSVPESEYQECHNKAGALFAALKETTG